jgi:hypothetical protein
VRHRLTAAHCDCQYPVNSQGLFYSEIGALVAPRPMLLVNAERDPGFPMDAFEEMAAKIGEIYRLYGAEQRLQTAVAPGGHDDTEAIRLPVYSFFLKTLLGVEEPVRAEGPVEEPPVEALVSFPAGLPLEERLSRIDEEFIPSRRRPAPAHPERRIAELAAQLRQEVFHSFPERPAPLDPTWEHEQVAQGRRLRRVTFQGLEGLRVRAIYSLPEKFGGGRLPAVLWIDHRRGIPVWGNHQAFERAQWGDRAVLLVETLDQGARALERNLRSFADDDLAHHMRRLAMVMGTTIESIQLYEILRALDLLHGRPEVDPHRVTIVGRGATGVNGLYAALLDGSAARVVLGSPPGSHRDGPHYLGILRYTDIPEVASLLGGRLRLFGEIPAALESVVPTGSRCQTLADCLR